MLSVVGLFNLLGALFTTALLVGVYRSKPDFSRFDKFLDKYLLLKILVVVVLLTLFAIQMDFIESTAPYLSVFLWLNSLLYVVSFFIHEGGHIYFAFFGEFIKSLGGTLNETLIPLGFCFWAYRQKAYLVAAMFFFWLGYNLIGVSNYVADARAQVLEIMGGEGRHDWNHMLGQLSLLEYDQELAAIVRALAIATSTLSILFIAFYGTFNSALHRIPPNPGQ